MPSESAEAPAIRLVLDSDPIAVREALKTLFEGRTLRLLPDDERGTAEIVLAEVLNNVVEHAYASASGKIEVTILISPGALTCTIVDSGKPIPGETLPTGGLCGAVGNGELPEGGFGWHLIRALSRDLAYARVEDRNRLTLRLEAGQSAEVKGTVSQEEQVPQSRQNSTASPPGSGGTTRV